MIGAEHALMSRMPAEPTVVKFREIIRWYRTTAERLNVDMRDNLVPENKAGGLINICIKSLGAVVKGGATAIQGILDYGEAVRKPSGLYLMQGPGNDIESLTGIVASETISGLNSR